MTAAHLSTATTELTADQLAAALRAGAAGYPPYEAAYELLIRGANGYWLHSPRLRTRYLSIDPAGRTHDGQVTTIAKLEWRIVDQDLQEPALFIPTSSACSIIALAGALAGRLTTDLSKALYGLDDRDTRLLLTVVAHRKGWGDRGVSALITGVLDEHPAEDGAGAGEP